MGQLITPDLCAATSADASSLAARAFYLAHNFTKSGEVAFKIGDGSYPNDILVRM